MTHVWRGEPEPPMPRPDAGGWLRAARRGLPTIALLGLGLAAHGALRLGERAVAGDRRPWSPRLTVAVCRAALRLMGLPVARDGTPMTAPGAFVANHASWLDILVLNAQVPLVFVAKAEVERWGPMGALARATGTEFVRRDDRRGAAEQARRLAGRLARGERLLFFPEGTSSDNRRVLPFKTPLFAALLSPSLPLGAAVQPVTVRYEAPPGADPRLLAWWGDMEFGPHVLAVLAAPGRGSARVAFHAPIPVAGRDRKALAAEAEAAVRAGL